MADQDPLVEEAEQRQTARDELLSSLAEKGVNFQAAEPNTSGDPLEDDEEAERAARDSLVDSLVHKDVDSVLLAVGAKSSGDPLVDDAEDLAAARQSLVNSLAAKDADTSLLAEQDGVDPLAESEARARKAREDLVKGLAKKDPSLEAEQTLNPKDVIEGLRSLNDFSKITLAEDAALSSEAAKVQQAANRGGVEMKPTLFLEEDDRRTDTLQAAEVERQRILEARELERQRALVAASEPQVKANALKAEDEQIRRRQLDATKTTLLVADPDHAGRYLAVDTANTAAAGVASHSRVLAASESRMREATSSTGTTDLTQMFGGAFLLVAAVALIAVVGRRRRVTKKQDEENDRAYQLFM